MSLKYIIEEFKNYGTPKYNYSHPSIFISPYELLIYLEGEDNFHKATRRYMRTLREEEENLVLENYSLNPLDFQFKHYKEKIMDLIYSKSIAKRVLINYYNQSHSILLDIASYFSSPLCTTDDYVNFANALKILAIDFTDLKLVKFLGNMCAWPMCYYKVKEDMVRDSDEQYDQYFKIYLRKYTTGHLNGNEMSINYKSKFIYVTYGQELIEKVRHFLKYFDATKESKIDCLSRLCNKIVSRSTNVCLYNTDYARVYSINLEYLLNDSANDYNYEVDYPYISEEEFKTEATTENEVKQEAVFNVDLPEPKNEEVLHRHTGNRQNNRNEGSNYNISVNQSINPSVHSSRMVSRDTRRTNKTNVMIDNNKLTPNYENLDDRPINPSREINEHREGEQDPIIENKPQSNSTKRIERNNSIVKSKSKSKPVTREDLKLDFNKSKKKRLDDESDEEEKIMLNVSKNEETKSLNSKGSNRSSTGLKLPDETGKIENVQKPKKKKVEEEEEGGCVAN